jgi:hypothetical protein
MEIPLETTSITALALCGAFTVSEAAAMPAQAVSATCIAEPA